MATILLSIKFLNYICFFRLILEYASVFWSPFNKTNIDKIKMVQCKAARFVLMIITDSLVFPTCFNS